MNESEGQERCRGGGRAGARGMCASFEKEPEKARRERKRKEEKKVVVRAFE